MRQCAWYSPELNVIVLQTIENECFITYEWGYKDLYQAHQLFGEHADPMEETLWMPLGEI